MAVANVKLPTTSIKIPSETSKQNSVSGITSNHDINMKNKFVNKVFYMNL